ncbi:unnamed protein product [Heterobilharzia americana]|nr:unnamed protein product [Heterobilharzia americana]
MYDWNQSHSTQALPKFFASFYHENNIPVGCKLNGLSFEKTDNMARLLVLCFSLLISVHNLVTKQIQEDNDWSMIMEVEVEDPVFNSSNSVNTNIY